MSLNLWIAAAAAGLVASAALYVGRLGGSAAPGRRVLLGAAALLRAAAVALLVALLLDAPVGRATAGRRITVLDASRSWLRGGDSATWRTARDRSRSDGGELWIAGDSVRAGAPPALPSDEASTVRTAVERAASGGRALTIITDGEVSDAERLGELPPGSRVDVLTPRRRPDLALAALDAPASAAVGDSIAIRLTIVGDSAGGPARRVTARVGAGAEAAAPVPALATFGEQTLELRVPGPPRAGTALLTVALGGGADGEARNDTLTAAIEVTATPAAVFVSTGPDFDARFALEVLRGSLSLPATAYFRVAPGEWRDDRTYAEVDEATVRAALRAAPVAALHGDTAYFGAPEAAISGAAVLVPRFDDRGEEWFAAAAPPSPVAAALSGAPWDSLPPVGVSAAPPPRGQWTALEARLGRSGPLRPVVTGREGARRVAVVAASGLWRWRFRGGVSADVYAALWGGIFDWLAEGRSDRRAALPAGPVRAGEPVRWRRGVGDSSSVEVVLARRGAPGRADTVRLRFTPGSTIAESPPLPPGVYDARSVGGTSVLVVNPSAEWVPRRPTIRAATTRGRTAPAGLVGLRTQPWAFLLPLALLCAEWLLRRRLALR